LKLFIAIATYDGKLTTPCVESLLKAVNVLRDEGHIVTPYFHSGNVYIAAARNVCVYYFLKSDCDNMIFIDADVGFEKDSISKLLVHDKDIIAGIYPLKQDKKDFPMTLLFDKNNNCKEEATGLVYAKMVPTGFMRIKRKVFEEMSAHYNMKKSHEEMYSFFDTGMIFENDNTWYGEDIAFCKRWVEMGGEMFIEPNINFIHTGTKHWKGNVHEYLMGRTIEGIEQHYDDQEGINGWTSKQELNLLSELAAKSDSVVEVGSWKGRSTKVLLGACKGKVYAVDHWKGSSGDLTSVMARKEDVYSEFINNVGSFPNLTILKGYSTDIAKSFNENKIDMVFIDAEHTYESCKDDIEAWLPKCTKYICGHDYSDNFPGVKQAVNEKFGKVNIVDSLWWVEL
jgi:hypothetical protein